MDAAIAYVAAAACDLAIVPAEDMIGLDEAPNLPGTIDEHPNWRRRLPDARPLRGRPSRRARRHPCRGQIPMTTPRATYRLQFHAGFPFADAVPLAPYLAALGVSHVYASPIGTARAGSTHGYDQVDPGTIDPALGGEAGFRALAAALKAEGLGLIVDIVPNHMAVGHADNPWWLDVLAKGEASPYARWFDIDWRAGGDAALDGRLLAPFLGAPLAEVLGSGDLVVDVEGPGGPALVAYDTHRFPIRAEDHAAVLADPAGYDGTTEAGRAALSALHDRQHYRLAWWRTAGDRINWRRFFDITELAGLRVEDAAVFDAVHALPLRLYAEGLIDGVRVDHVDGLADPGGYCRRLRAALAAAEPQRPADAAPGPAWLVVEKILGPGERLDPAWETDGTSGYDFMDEVSALQHDPAGQAAFDALWADVSGRPADFHAEERQARIETLARTFPGQHAAAAAAFTRLAEAVEPGGDVTQAAVARALAALLEVFPAYRSYGAGEAEPAALDAAVAQAEPAPGEGPLIARIADWIAGRADRDRPERAEAVRRFEQLSAPLSAKAVEDTAFYRYGRLLSRTDVGFDPATFALDAAGFAALSAERARDFPHAMLTTATHDHKRGEDVRARLAALSEVPDAWAAAARGWLAHPAFAGVDPADAYQVVQTLVGAWPLEDAARGDLADRVVGWSGKALREAKLRSSWTAPDEAYEGRVADAIRALLADAAFTGELNAFVARIAAAGAANGIAQAVLRCTLPGVPDCYQGCELWDFSLVDPDNRRPVDYARRRALLADGGDWRSGAPKQGAIAAALAARRDDPALFADGGFEMVAGTGVRAGNLFAFVRRLEGRALLVAVPLRVAAAFAAGDGPVVPADWWGDTALSLPGGGVLPVAEALGERGYVIRAV
ncbi:MAG: malto-oligosyltrehalose synthase [Sphingomonas fennica]